MVKNTLAFFGLLSVLLLSFAVVSATTYTETFDNSNATGTYNDGSFLGENDITWNYEDARAQYDDYDITGNGIIFRNEDGKIYSDTISGGIASFSVKLQKASATTGDRQIELLINGILQETYDVTNDLVNTFTVSDINIEGNIVIEIKNTADRHVIIDDITWTNYTAPTDPTPTNYNFCEINGKIGDLKISDVTFTNLGQGEDEDWYLLDEIEIEVEIENTDKTNSIKDVLVEIKILDSDGNDATKDFEFDNEEIDLNTVKKDDSEIATFKIKELPADIESGDYKLFIKAYSDGNEEEQCVAEAATKYLDNTFYQSIDVTREDDPAVIIKQTITPIISASCGDKSISIPASIYNLGSDKEDKVLVTLTNSILGIDEKIVIDNLKSGKRKEIEFFIDLPKELSKSLYVLELKTYYDYDKDEDELSIQSYSESSFNDLDKTFSVRLEILSCQEPSPTIDAILASETTLGEELTVKATITNNGADNDFAISVTNFESWANIISVTPQTATINKKESAEIIIKFIPTKEGAQIFKINTIVDGETYEQTVSVNISAKPSIFTGINNELLYIIIAIVAILIIIFLALIIKISRRQSKPQF